jgi:sugar phosphate isomerase/epimerase
MKESIQKLPFTIGAPSMIFRKNMVENVRRLASFVPHIEILLFHQPDINNIPTPDELNEIKAIGNGEGISFSVHLPASLEIASPDHIKRQHSLELTRQCCMKTAGINPLHYIIHVPYSPPTLTTVPGLYFNKNNADRRQEWINHATESLQLLHEEWHYPGSLLVENINFSPSMLEPLWNKGLCEFCLDIGHLILGNEDVETLMNKYLPMTRDIHLHGVRGNDEHLSLAVYPKQKIKNWLSFMREHFRGVLNLEVFSPEDLEESLGIILELARSGDD